MWNIYGHTRDNCIMTKLHQRLHDGHPTLSDHLLFRLCGGVCIAGFGLITRHLLGPAQTLSATPGLVLAFGAVACLFAGLALLLAGPTLFCDVDEYNRQNKRR